MIFAYAGGFGKSVMTAAEAAGGAVIGVDVDQSQLSDTVVFSATKSVKALVMQALALARGADWEGGRVLRATAAQEGVGLSMAGSRLTGFTEEDYRQLQARMANGSLVVLADPDAPSLEGLNLGRVQLTVAP